MSQNMKKNAAISHNVNERHFNSSAAIRAAITSLLWITLSKPHKAEYSHTKASKLVQPLADLGTEKGWEINSPKLLLDAAAEAMPKAQPATKEEPKPEPKKDEPSTKKPGANFVKGWLKLAEKRGKAPSDKVMYWAKYYGLVWDEAAFNAEAAANAPLPKDEPKAEQVSEVASLRSEVAELKTMMAAFLAKK